MDRTVVFTDPVTADLTHIRDHVGQDDPVAGTRLVMQLITTCGQLKYLPERGRIGLVSGTRELVTLRPYVIVYRITPQEVQILRIWHGAQDRLGK